MIVDYHLHLRDEAGRVEHSVAAVERFVEAADARGVAEIGLTEHVYYFRQTERLWTVPYQVERCLYDLDRYCDAVLDAKAAGMPVKLGLEVDYVRGREDETNELLEPYPWDYRLGSVHFIDGLGVDGEPKLVDAVGVEEAWCRYFDELVAAAASELFDSLAHPDLVKIFGDRAPRDVAERLYARAADALAEAHVAVEVSSAGLRKPVGELYPARELLEACRARDVPITLASDAHTPRLAGEGLEAAVELATGAGYETVTVFDGRHARQEPLG